MRRSILITWIGFVVLLVVLSLLPSQYLPFFHRHQSEAGHFGFYFVIALLPVWGALRRSLGIAIGLSAILLGALLEFGQRYIPGRHFDTEDMLLNTLGVLLGIAAALLLRRALPHRPIMVE